MNLKNALTESLPKYSCDLPYSKIKTKFRPFLVKEEKKLLILEETSSQAEIYNGIIEVLEACFSENVNFRKLPLFEVEYCFLKLRAKSVGELITPKIVCPVTGESHVVSVDLNEINLKINENPESIELGNNFILHMRYPSVGDLIDDSGDINTLVSNCIISFEDKTEKVEADNFSKSEIKDFLENMTSSQYEKIIAFFEKMPSLEIKVQYQTKDLEVRELTLKGIKDFFS